MKALLRHIDWLTEDSFGPSDIPDNFYLVIEFDPEDGDRMKQLGRGKLEGIGGISGSNVIVLKFMPRGRKAVLKMDGRKIIKKNDISKVNYDNPHYLMSNDMWALKRLLNVGDASKPKIRRGIIENIMMKFYVKHNKDHHSDGGKVLFWIKSREREFYQQVAKEKIDSVKDLARRIHSTIEGYFDAELPFSLRDWMRVVREGVEYIGENYADEQEWIIKSETLKVPVGSTLMLDTAQVEGELKELYEKWKDFQLTGEPMDLTDEEQQKLGRKSYWFKKRLATEQVVDEFDLDERYIIRYTSSQKIRDIAYDILFR